MSDGAKVWLERNAGEAWLVVASEYGQKARIISAVVDIDDRIDGRDESVFRVAAECMVKSPNMAAMHVPCSSSRLRKAIEHFCGPDAPKDRCMQVPLNDEDKGHEELVRVMSVASRHVRETHDVHRSILTPDNCQQRSMVHDDPDAADDAADAAFIAEHEADAMTHLAAQVREPQPGDDPKREARDAAGRAALEQFDTDQDLSKLERSLRTGSHKGRLFRGRGG